MRRISHVDCLITDISLSSLTPISDLIRGFGEYRMPLSPMAARRLWICVPSGAEREDEGWRGRIYNQRVFLSKPRWTANGLRRPD